MRSLVILACAFSVAACAASIGDPGFPAEPPPDVVVGPPRPPAPPDEDPPPPPDDQPPACPTDLDPGLAVVATESGSVVGEQDADLFVWRGIPFAAPPVAERRFVAPEPFGCFADTWREATEYGVQCPQEDILTGDVVGEEDCLTLNIWSPDYLGDDARPVLFFIHGGANVIGSSAQVIGDAVMYDGADLARDGDAVVVTVNYRLGALGFLAHESLRDENGRAGNYAMLDLIRALEWVRDNIAAFGGDPARVMVFGESAGALNTCALLASPLAEGLFSAALMESGGCDAPSQAVREEQGDEVVAQLGCEPDADVRTCLMTTHASDLARAAPSLPTLPQTWWMTYGPAVDGHVLESSPIEVLEAGSAHDVPFVIGSNASEQNLFLPPGTVNTCLEYAVLADLGLGDQATEAMTLYPCLAYPTPHMAYIAMATDAAFTCQARRAARAMRDHGTADVWRYWFADRADWGALAPLGAFHAWELFYVFDKLADVPGYFPSFYEQELADRMQHHWARLAHDGDPADDDAGFGWEAYGDEENVLILDELVSAVSATGYEARCDFWDSLVP